MFWKYAKSLSMTDRLLLIFICSTLLILSIITGLIYPPMKELLQQSTVNHEHYSYILTNVCIKKFFIALWISTLIIIGASYLLAKKSMRPLRQFTEKLAAINASSLDQRLAAEGIPKELQALAQTCDAMLNRIEHAFHHIKQFSTAMAHELRTPIHYLQTTTEITLAKPQTVEGYQQILQTQLEAYQGLSQLIDNLLFLTRCEHKQVPLTIKPFSAYALIHSVVDYYQYLAQEKNIDIQISGDAQIRVDEQLFKRVISNLIDNSIAYSDNNGKISISIEKGADNKQQIRIKDNGVGIAKEHLPLLCRGFYRVNHDKSQGNVGLGLAIAKSIMEQHQGQLVIQSKLGVGTEVVLLQEWIPA